MTGKRTRVERAAAARDRLQTDPNVWVATASTQGVPHLVPLSLAWIDDQVVVATTATSVTARNIGATGRARVSLDSADDVVIIDTDARLVTFSDAAGELVNGYVDRVGWNPSNEPGEWVLLVLTPTRGHAWIGPAEIDGRTFIRDGVWLA